MKGINNNKRQEDLLNKLISDSCSSIPENKRTIDNISIEALIWNLFKGDYQYNVTDVKYIINKKLGIT